MVRALVIGSAAAGFSLAAGAPFVALLRQLNLGKAISAEGPQSHRAKAGTPTLGGLLILFTVAIFALAAIVFDKPSLLLPLGVMGVTGLMGVLDDSLTLAGRERFGAHERLGFLVKEAALIAVGLLAGLVLVYSLDTDEIRLPWAGVYGVPAGVYVLAAVLVIVATASASAVTDGLDGLLGGLMALAFVAYGGIALIEDQRMLAAFCFAVVGALLGFLWYNAHPAQVFMGDSGALPLGAGLATVALMTGWWLLLPVVGVVLLAEALSDIAQIGSYRLTGRRVLRMAPLHHHFELAGWPETRVVLRFWLVGAVGALLALALTLTD